MTHWKRYDDSDKPQTGDIVRAIGDDAPFSACIIRGFSDDSAVVYLARPHCVVRAGGYVLGQAYTTLELFAAVADRFGERFEVAITGRSMAVDNRSV